MTIPAEACAVLDCWFGDLDADGLASKAKQAQWFKKDPDFDARLTEQFGALHARLAGPELPEGWDAPRARLAAVIVLDQFSRNMFRDTAAMFASDGRARDLSLAMVESGEDRDLATHERVFLYMPFMHAEDVDDQQRCCALMRTLRDAAQGDARAALDSNVDFADRHLEIVERFGRFPHRNALLGRESSEDEIAFLSQPGSSF